MEGPEQANGRVAVIVPTYNERANIEATVGRVRAAVPDADLLVVDDGSPDGTGPLADELAAADPRVRVLHRSGKLGLGSAYIAGFRHALAADYQFVFEMDADFSHDPKYLGDLLAATADADLVLGSRYVPGGGVRNWSLIRRLISRGGGIYARAILGVGIHDLTGGFKCIHRDVLEAIDLPSVRADGYVFQIEVTYRAILAGFRVKEVPIVFPDRVEGTSKMSSRIAIEAMFLVPRLRRSAKRAVQRGRLNP